MMSTCEIAQYQIEVEIYQIRKRKVCYLADQLTVLVSGSQEVLVALSKISQSGPLVGGPFIFIHPCKDDKRLA